MAQTKEELEKDLVEHAAAWIYSALLPARDRPRESFRDWGNVTQFMDSSAPIPSRKLYESLFVEYLGDTFGVEKGSEDAEDFLIELLPYNVFNKATKLLQDRAVVSAPSSSYTKDLEYCVRAESDYGIVPRSEYACSHSFLNSFPRGEAKNLVSSGSYDTLFEAIKNIQEIIRNTHENSNEVVNDVDEIPIPAADRIVDIGDNYKEERSKLADDLGELESLVVGYNGEFPDKEVAVDEISQGKEIIKKPRIFMNRLESLWEMVKWLAVRFANEAIGQVASALSSGLSNLIQTIISSI